MNIRIAPAIIEQFPEVKIGILIGHDVDNTAHSPEISARMRQAEKAVCAQDIQDVTLLPKIADWREAYRAFGCKPSKYRCSVESLLRRVLQGNELPTINPLVDIYNIISISHQLPLGGGNLERIEGDMQLTKAQGTERFVMLGDTEPTPIPAGEVIYVDDKDVLCRAWNYRESDKTKITSEIKQVYLMLEGLEHTTHAEIEQALAELQALVSMYCGGTFKSYVLDAQHPMIAL